MTTSLDRRNTAWATHLQSDTELFCSVWIKGRQQQGALLEEASSNPACPGRSRNLGSQRLFQPPAKGAALVWTCSVAYSSRCSARGCAKTHLFSVCRLSASGNQSKTCRSHCISQRSSLGSPACPTMFLNHGCSAGKPGSSVARRSCREPTRAAGGGSGSKRQCLGSGAGKSLVCSAAVLQNQ